MEGVEFGPDGRSSLDVKVILDLRTEVLSALDEGLGASVLEQVVDIIGSWGAEAILAEVNPLCEAAVASVPVNRGITEAWTVTAPCPSESEGSGDGDVVRRPLTRLPASTCSRRPRDGASPW